MFWTDKYVLRELEVTDKEREENCFLFYRFAIEAEDITPNHNVFDTPPFDASMEKYRAIRVVPHQHWDVTLKAGATKTVKMGVFKLERI